MMFIGQFITTTATLPNFAMGRGIGSTDTLLANCTSQNSVSGKLRGAYWTNFSVTQTEMNPLPHCNAVEECNVFCLWESKPSSWELYLQKNKGRVNTIKKKYKV